MLITVKASLLDLAVHALSTYSDLCPWWWFSKPCISVFIHSISELSSGDHHSSDELKSESSVIRRRYSQSN